MELKTSKTNMDSPSAIEGHVHCFNICECGKVRLPGHICIFNKCQCGAIQILKDAPSESGGGAFGKSTTDRKAGAAFTAIGKTEKQKDIRIQIVEDHSSIASNMDKMTDSVNAIRSDVDDLKKYLKNNASAMKKLNGIQEKLNNQIMKSLAQEKNKMALKDAELNKLEEALKTIERNQACIKASFMAGKAAQALVCLILLWGILAPIFYQTGIIKVD